MSDPKHSDIVSARERGLIGPETMAAAVRCEPRALAYTQWKLDGNDGPASPPEGWQAEVTAETLTDEQIRALRLHPQSSISDRKWCAVALDEFGFGSKTERSRARVRIAHAINARREGSR